MEVTVYGQFRSVTSPECVTALFDSGAVLEVLAALVEGIELLFVAILSRECNESERVVEGIASIELKSTNSRGASRCERSGPVHSACRCAGCSVLT